MANFNILNLSERNIASETIVGQANDSTLARVSKHPDYDTIYTQQVAIQRGHLVGIDSTDGKIYNAYAGLTAGSLVQRQAHGFAFKELPNGVGMDVMRTELEVKLDAPLSGVTPGCPAYLSDITPGYPTPTKPTVTGHIVQLVGFFLNSQTVKYQVGLLTTTL